MDGQDVIGHLMSVEREAASLLANAQAEADRRKAAATEEASKKFKDAYERIVASAEAGFARDKKAIDERRAQALSAYQATIEAIPLSPSSFNTYLDSVFSGT